jgi:tetratricopeptide (TPR) repeat protein
MIFSCKLQAILIGVAIAFVPPRFAIALTAADVNNIAQDITVLINAKDPSKGGAIVENGSGSIIAKEGNNYYVLTANHVVCKTPERAICQRRYDYQIVTYNGKKYSLDNSKIEKLPGVDLAVLQFTSQENYQLATLANYELATDEQFMYASGWAAPNRYMQRQQRLFSIGKIIPKDIMPLFRIFPPSYGYELVYTSRTYGGMSGGPVLDTDGRVIAVHGQNEGELVEDLQSQQQESVRLAIGYSRGIPISTFLRLAPKSGMRLRLKVESKPPVKPNLRDIGDQYYREFPAPGPNNTNAIDLANYGNQMWRMGQLALALSSYDKALQINPEFYQVWYQRGLMLTYWRKFNAAMESYDKALQIIEKRLQEDSNLEPLQIVRQNVLKLRENLQRLTGAKPETVQSDVINVTQKGLVPLPRMSKVKSQKSFNHKAFNHL